MKAGPGRPKGLPNKNTLRFAERLKELEVDLIEEVLKLLPELEPHQRATALLTMMKYTYPTYKSIEMQLDDKSGVILTRSNVAQLCEIARKASVEAATNHDPA